MPMIEFEWELKLPNEFMVDHSMDQGNTRTCVYDGPDKLYLIVNNETGKEDFGPITAEEKADGRPCPTGHRYVEVDCTENPLVCQLRGPVIDEAEEEYTGAYPHPLSPAVEGYPRFEIQTPLMPGDIYDSQNLYIDSEDNITVPVKSIAQCLFDREELLTWDDVKKERNQLLANSDIQFAPDMPEEMIEEWKKYRKLLRDLPDNLAGTPAWIAAMMLPVPPFSDPPED